MTTSSAAGSGSGTSAQVSTSGPPASGIVTACMWLSIRRRCFAGPSAPRQTGEPLVGLDVPGAGRLDHLGGHNGAGLGLVPARAGRPVAHHLFVERVLGIAWFPAVGRPEAR